MAACVPPLPQGLVTSESMVCLPINSWHLGHVGERGEMSSLYATAGETMDTAISMTAIRQTNLRNKDFFIMLNPFLHNVFVNYFKRICIAALRNSLENRFSAWASHPFLNGRGSVECCHYKSKLYICQCYILTFCFI